LLGRPRDSSTKNNIEFELGKRGEVGHGNINHRGKGDEDVGHGNDDHGVDHGVNVPCCNCSARSPKE
jgi:hypothetical protein